MTDSVLVVGDCGFGRETVAVLEAVDAASETPAFDVVDVLPDRRSCQTLALEDTKNIGAFECIF